MGTKQLNWTVASCLGLFAFIYLTVVTCVIIPWLNYSVPGATNLGLLTFNTGTALCCYLLCVFSDPGSVPEDYAPDADEQPSVMEVKRKSGTARYCQKCKRHKPPRSHHCRLCQRCVLRMCHHCPWINNCVGHANLKAFLLFLLYVNAAAWQALGLFVAHAIHVVKMHGEKRAHSLKAGPGATQSTRATMLWAVLQTSCMAVTLPVALGLALLLAWNVYLVYNNKTTIEYHEGVTARVLASRIGQAYKHPYDLGICANLWTICGPKPQLWLFPSAASAHGDGVNYLTFWDAEALDGF